MIELCNVFHNQISKSYRGPEDIFYVFVRDALIRVNRFSDSLIVAFSSGSEESFIQSFVYGSQQLQITIYGLQFIVNY